MNRHLPVLFAVVAVICVVFPAKAAAQNKLAAECSALFQAPDDSATLGIMPSAVQSPDAAGYIFDFPSGHAASCIIKINPGAAVSDSGPTHSLKRFTGRFKSGVKLE